MARKTLPNRVIKGSRSTADLGEASLDGRTRIVLQRGDAAPEHVLALSPSSAPGKLPKLSWEWRQGTSSARRAELQRVYAKGRPPCGRLPLEFECGVFGADSVFGRFSRPG